MELKNKKSSLSKKTFYIISLLASADVLVFIFPSYLRNVISSEIIALNLGISPAQLSQAIAIYGYISLIIYFFGSIIGDKISLKWLTITGLAAFGLSGIWYGSVGLTYGGGLSFDSTNNTYLLNPIGQSQRYTQVIIIYSIWAFAKIIFWAPLWKLLSQQGRPDQNGQLNGIHGSLNGFIGTIFVGIGYAVFMILSPFFMKEIDPSSLSFSIMCFMFSGLILINVILLILFIKEDKKNAQENTDFALKDIKGVLANKKVWLLSLVVMGVYMYQQGLSVLVPFMGSTLLISASIIFIGGLLRTYLFRFIFSAPAGKMADKTGKYIKFLVIGTFICSIIMLIVLFLPGFKVGGFNSLSRFMRITIQVITYILFLSLGAMCWGLVTNRWATIYEIGVDHKQYATAVGLVSVIAFSPDAWFWQINSLLLNKYKQEDPNFFGGWNYQVAYQYSIVLIIVGGVVGVVAGLALMFMIKKEVKNI